MRSEATKPELIDHLLAKYREDPERFRAYLPEVADALDSLAPVPRPRRDPSALTERERQYHEQRLRDLLGGQGKRTFSAQDAARGLEHCTALIQDGSLPYEVDSKHLISLLKAVIGVSPGTVKKVTTFPVRMDGEGKAVSHVSVLRGVQLDLTWDRRLVSITVNPRTWQERRKLLAVVGIGQDTATDVAVRHDHYLAEIPPHGNH